MGQDNGDAFGPGCQPSASAIPASRSGIPIAGDLRVWWVPQLPMKAFEVDVPDLQTASLLLDVLGRYDAFQFEHNVKPGYCNGGGLLEFDEGVADWFDWEHPETLDDFDTVRRDPDLLPSASEARRAETAQTGSVHESAVGGSRDAPEPHP